MNITITGDPGSGKSALAKALADMLNYKVVDAGQIYRDFAVEHDKSIDEAFAAGTDNFDEYLDSSLRTMNENEDRMIFVSRTAWKLLDNVFSIYVTALPTVGAKRIYNDARESEKTEGVLDTLKRNAERQVTEDRRYLEMYKFTREDTYRGQSMVLCPGSRSISDCASLVASCLSNQKQDRVWALSTDAYVPAYVNPDFRSKLRISGITYAGVAENQCRISYSHKLPIVVLGVDVLHDLAASDCKFVTVPVESVVIQDITIPDIDSVETYAKAIRRDLSDITGYLRYLTFGEIA